MIHSGTVRRLVGGLGPKVHTNAVKAWNLVHLKIALDKIIQQLFVTRRFVPAFSSGLWLLIFNSLCSFANS